jgi:endonuclease V-like protein UPF0215 family
MVLTPKTKQARQVQEVTNAPVITTVEEKPIVDVIENKTNVFVHKRPVITEIIEQPIIEVNESREVVHTREKSVHNQSVESTRFEDVNPELRMTENQKIQKLRDLEKFGARPQFQVEQSELVVQEAERLKRVEIQPIIERHEQKLIKEIHETDVHEEIEQPIVRRIYRQPVFRKIGENLFEQISEEESTIADELKRDVVVVGNEIKTASQAISDEVKHDVKFIGSEIKKGAVELKQEAQKGIELAEKEARHLKRVAERRGYFNEDFWVPLGLMAVTGIGLFLYDRYYTPPRPL